MKAEKEIEKWWDETSEYFQKDFKLHTKAAQYGPHTPNEDDLKLLGKVKGKKILEIGCGGGQCSIAFAKGGAICTGIDISKEQLKYAKNLAKEEKVKVKFIKCNFQNLKRFKSNSFDIAFSAWAFQYSPDLKRLFKETHRILKKNGLFVFSLNHPFRGTIDTKTHKVTKSYYKTGKNVEIEVWPDGSKHKFVNYKRKVSDIFNTLVETGFVVEKILEPISFKEKTYEKYYKKDLSKLIGPTIIFKARKGVVK